MKIKIFQAKNKFIKCIYLIGGIIIPVFSILDLISTFSFFSVITLVLGIFCLFLFFYENKKEKEDKTYSYEIECLRFDVIET
jgi:hypothetical protein